MKEDIIYSLKKDFFELNKLLGNERKSFIVNIDPGMKNVSIQEIVTKQQLTT